MAAVSGPYPATSQHITEVLHTALGCRWHPHQLEMVRQRLSVAPYIWTDDTCDMSSWKALIDTAASERVSGLVYEVFQGQDICPPSIERQLHDAYAYTAIQNRILLSTLGEVLDILDGAGIPVIVLKGAALTEAYYGHIGLRPMVDLDLLVHQHDVPDAQERLSTIYFQPLDKSIRLNSVLAYENELALVRFSHLTEQVELHWGLFDSPHHQAIVDEEWFWQTARPITIADRSALILGFEAQLLHLCGHLLLHHAATSNLLWVCDVAEVVYHDHDKIDWETVVAKAQAYDLVLAVAQTLHRIVTLWQAPVPEAILTRLATAQGSSVEARLLKERSKASRPVSQRFWSDLVAFPGWRVRLTYAWQSLVPSPAYMKQRYRIRRRVLLPLAYLYRWLLGMADLLHLRE